MSKKNASIKMGLAMTVAFALLRCAKEQTGMVSVFIAVWVMLLGTGVRAVTVWTGAGAGDKWSTASNWTSAGEPTGTDLVFGTNDRAVKGVVNNIVDADVTISSLSYTNSTREAYVSNKYAHTTQIGTGVTLTVDGSTSPTHAFVVGGRRLTGQYATYVNMTGGGDLVVDAESSDFVVNNPSSDNRGDVYFDMSGLSSMDAAVSNFYVGYGYGSGRARVYMYLPTSESKTNKITTTAMVVGDTDGNTGTDGDVHLYLGRHNEINADKIRVGAIANTATAGQAADGYVQFQNFSGAMPTVKIRGKIGGNSRADLSMAQLGSNTQEKNKFIEASVDFRSGIVDAMLGHVLISEAEAYVAATTNFIGSLGTLSMGAGTIDVTSITLGRSIYRSGYPASSLGILNVTGGVFRAASMSLAENAFNGGCIPHGVVHVSGSGRVEVSGDVTLGTRVSANELIATVAISNGMMTVLGNMAPASASATITSDVLIAGGDLFVTNAADTATLRIEHGTLSLVKGRAVFDNLDMSSDAAVTSFALSGTNAGEFVQVEIHDKLELGGSLVVTAVDGYTPQLGDSWTFISGSGTRVGGFKTMVLLEGMEIDYTGNGFILSIPGINTEVVLNLDLDCNGLYDDTERKAMLDVLQAECPEVEAAYDADGDGKVTILEQTQGLDPLSMRLPRRFLQRTNKIPWAIDLFPEWLSTEYLQEDVVIGKIAQQSSRGTMPMAVAQSVLALQPSKTSEGRGVEFAANSGQYLTMPGVQHARWSYRWCLFTFRLDGSSGNNDTTVLLDINKGTLANRSSPKIWYSKQTGLNIQYLGRNKGGLDKRLMIAGNVVADGETWNTVVCGIRYGQMFAAVNGVLLTSVSAQPERFSGDWLNDTMYSYLGDPSTGNMAWAYDVLVFGLTEPSEAMVSKMTGWAAHRLGSQANLPADHPYKNHRPLLDAEDLPYRYVHHDEKWDAWGASIKVTANTRVNAGGPRYEPAGFERVFYDDFRTNRVSASTSGEGDLWVGSGFNPAVGANAQLVTPGRTPNTYAYDAVNQKQSLSLIKENGKWYGSAFYSVNDLGHGYTWTGPKIFRIRCMFPAIAQADLAGGLFPAFWSYDPDFLFWRTSNRIEVDWFEFDGQNGQWLNGLSSHYHAPNLANIFVKRASGDTSYKVYSGELSEAKGKIPGGLYFWDGQFHTWEFVVDDAMTFVNVTVPDANGNDQWVEVCRCATAPTYLERLDLQLDYALRTTYGEPTNGAQQDFFIDFVEVLQKTENINVLPESFSVRPELMGSAEVGSSITCNPNVDGIQDVRYYWFADGYPLTYGVSNSWLLTEAEAGKEIRCMVKAVGALDRPEAWSNTQVAFLNEDAETNNRTVGLIFVK